MCQFLGKTDNLEFSGTNLPKYLILGSEFQKFKSRFGISTTKIPSVPIFCKNEQLWIFRLNLGKLPNYVWYFGFNKGEGELRVLQSAGWRFKWAGWRWIELGAKFSNTLLKFCCEAIISWRFIICFRILWFHLSLMISSKCISASQRLKCSLDIFFMFGILSGNSSTLKKVLEPFLPFNSCLILAQSLAPFPCLFSYW